MNDAYKAFLKMQRESKRKDIYSNYDREELLDLIIEQEDKLEELDEKIIEYEEKNKEIEKRLRELINYTLKNYKENKLKKDKEVAYKWLSRRDCYLSILNYIQRINGVPEEFILEIDERYDCK